MIYVSRHLCVLLISLLVAPPCVAQVAEPAVQTQKVKNQAPLEHVITLDFNTKKFTTLPPDTIRRKDTYTVKITGINPLLYKVSVGARDTATDTALSVPTFASLGGGDLSAVSASLGSLGSILAATRSGGMLSLSDSRLISPKDTVVETVEDGAGFEEPTYPERFEKRVNQRPAASRKADAAMMLTSAYTLTLRKYELLLTGHRDQIDSIVAQADEYTLYARLQTQIGTVPVANDLKSLHDQIKKVRADILKLATRASKAATNYDQLSRKYNVAKILKEKDEKLRAAAPELDKGIDAAKSSVSAENARSLLDGLAVVINNSSREYVSLPFQFTKDQSRIVISITPRDEKVMLQPYRTELLFPLTKRTFWGVSSGFYASTLYNQAFSASTLLDSPQDTTAQYSLVSENPGKAEFGVNAMIRYGWHNQTNNVGFQVGFGPGLAISDKVRPRIMAGLGPVFGQNHKFIVDVGIIAGYVDRRSAVYPQDGPYFTPPGKTTVSQLRAGGYISLNYVFIKQ